jgi:hypothetical protein
MWACRWEGESSELEICDFDCVENLASTKRLRGIPFNIAMAYGPIPPPPDKIA